MEVTSSKSPAFGAIHVQRSKMNSWQRRISDRLLDSIKYSNKYSKMTRGPVDIDIYMLPVNKDEVELRLVDVISENFIKNKRGNIYKFIADGYCEYEKVADKVLKAYQKVLKGVIKRPKENVSEFISGNTDVCKIYPKNHDGFEVRAIPRLIKEGGISLKEAEKLVYNQHKSSVGEFNTIDTDF